MGSSSASKLLLALRGYGLRAWRSGRGTFPERLERFGFTKLREVAREELVFGIAGQFWRPSGGLRRIVDATAFEAFDEPGCVKAAWNLRLREIGGGQTDVSTETRIEYFGEAPRRKFRAYWSIVGPFSGLLRKGLLRDIEKKAAGSS